MPVSNIRDANVYGAIVQHSWKLGNVILDAGAGTLTAAATWPPVLIVDPGGGAANLDMPAEADVADQMFLVINTADAAEALTIRNDAAGTIIALAQSESVFLYCDGTSWHILQGAAV